MNNSEWNEAIDAAIDLCNKIEGGEYPDGSLASGLAWECANAIRELKRQPSEAHPPSRHCMCAECAPSFEDMAQAEQKAQPIKDAEEWQLVPVRSTLEMEEAYHASLTGPHVTFWSSWLRVLETAPVPPITTRCRLQKLEANLPSEQDKV